MIRIPGRLRLMLTLLITLLLAALMVPSATAAAAVSSTPLPSWSVNGRVYATEIVGDTVYVGGKFTSATSPSGQVVARRNLAAFSVTTGELRADFRANAGSTVRALVSDGSSLYVGGHFGRINGVSRPWLAKLALQTGAVDTSFQADPNGAVLGLDVQSGWLYAGGTFTTVRGEQHVRLAKVQVTTGVPQSTFTGSADAAVRAIVKSPTTDQLYAAGSFSSLSGSPRTGVGAVYASSGAVTGTVFRSSVRPTLGLAISDDGTQLFGAQGASRNSAIAWSALSGTEQWSVPTDGDIQAIEYHLGLVYFGFHDGYQGDTRIRLLRATAATGAVDTGFTPYFDLFWGVFTISVTDAGVVAGGEFTKVSGVPAQGIVRFR